MFEVSISLKHSAISSLTLLRKDDDVIAKENGNKEGGWN
jgi:hypothetical protein